jgi:hypothetical protein
MAWKRSGVRIPIAPHFSKLFSKLTSQAKCHFQ